MQLTRHTSGTSPAHILTENHATIDAAISVSTSRALHAYDEYRMDGPAREPAPPTRNRDVTSP